MASKVLLVSPYSAKKVGGIGTWTKNILEYSKEEKINILFLNTVFFLKSNLPKSLISRFFVGVVDTSVILSRLIYYLMRHKPNCVHYTSSGSLALYKDILAIYITKAFRKRFVIHFRFGRIPELEQIRDKEWRLLCKAITLADEVIVIDSQTYEVLTKQGFENILNIPNPISSLLERRALSFNPANQTLTSGKVVFVGHVKREKGIYELLQACLRLEDVKELVIIGPVLDEVKFDLNTISLSKNNGNWIKWRGEIVREAVFKDLSNANLMCLPSYTEGFPNAVLEAMAIGCPIVATDVGAIKEMLTSDDHGPAGICIKKENIDELVAAMDSIINSNEMANEMRINGNQRILSKYTLAKIFPFYMDAWKM